MICYPLLLSTSHSRFHHRPPYASPNNSPSSSPPTTTPYLVATSIFIQFLEKLLETTEVSQSIIVLSLHYLYRLKERNRFTPVQFGSEFRIAVPVLMMANKFLDKYMFPFLVFTLSILTHHQYHNPRTTTAHKSPPPMDADDPRVPTTHRRRQRGCAHHHHHHSNNNGRRAPSTSTSTNLCKLK